MPTIENTQRMDLRSSRGLRSERLFCIISIADENVAVKQTDDKFFRTKKPSDTPGQFFGVCCCTDRSAASLLKPIRRRQPVSPRIPGHPVQGNMDVAAVGEVHLVRSVVGRVAGVIDRRADTPVFPQRVVQPQ